MKNAAKNLNDIVHFRITEINKRLSEINNEKRLFKIEIERRLGELQNEKESLENELCGFTKLKGFEPKDNVTDIIINILKSNKNCWVENARFIHEELKRRKLFFKLQTIQIALHRMKEKGIIKRNKHQIALTERVKEASNKKIKGIK